MGRPGMGLAEVVLQCGPVQQPRRQRQFHRWWSSPEVVLCIYRGGKGESVVGVRALLTVGIVEECQASRPVQVREDRLVDVCWE
jgi:hypothetical protein